FVRQSACGKAIALSLLTSILAGCKGVPTKAERQARHDLKSVESTFRPNGKKPGLPVLTEDSGLSNYLTFAMLNQPKVETAYFDWAASVERITQARSFPDPQFTFQMDIQSAVTSVMPGLMGNIPWPDKLRVGAEVASQESRSKYFNFQGAVLESAYQVKRAYYQLYFFSEKIRINGEPLNLLSNREEPTGSKNEVGRTTLKDVFGIQMEKARLKKEFVTLALSRGAWIMQFRGAWGLKADDPPPPLP